MPYNRANLIIVSVMTVGAGSPLAIGAAISGYRPLSVLKDGATVNYSITDTPGNETGWGVIGASGTTLTRNFKDSNTGSLLSLSGAAQLMVTPLDTDLMENNLFAHALQGGI